VLGRILIALVRGYQVVVSPWTPPACRFTPSCSAYAIEAIAEHGALRGSWLAARRIGRCHPWGGFGYDPVPSSHGEVGSLTVAAEMQRAGSVER
jgi:putative membrane protein insertion efficiency factor